jgi:hypothetical protein
MNTIPKFCLALAFVGFLLPSAPALARGEGFDAAVKTIEQFYHVKHQSVPLLARAGLKATRAAARLRGGEVRRLAEAGSVRVAFFEDQDFNSHGRIADFKASINRTLNGGWSPLIQTLAAKDEEQTYVYLRDAGEKFHLLVVTIERREATVVEATVNPKTLAMLMQNPDDLGKAITEDATINDNQEKSP